MKVRVIDPGILKGVLKVGPIRGGWGDKDLLLSYERVVENWRKVFLDRQVTTWHGQILDDWQPFKENVYEEGENSGERPPAFVSGIFYLKSPMLSVFSPKVEGEEQDSWEEVLDFY